jgi:putative PIN family toxin of toxin-antitoxin system
MIWGGLPVSIIKAAEDGAVCIITSKEIINEISQTIAYPRLKRSCEDKGISQQQITEAVLRLSVLVEVKTRIHIVQDAADDKFVECALEGRADLIVSGDDHLLKIGSYRGIRIVSVSQVLEIIKKGHSH